MSSQKMLRYYYLILCYQLLCLNRLINIFIYYLVPRSKYMLNCMLVMSVMILN